MAQADVLLKKLRQICLSLPDAKETITWGEPHFRVNDKIFCGYGDERGRAVIGFKLEKRHAATIIQDARFWPAPYVGHKGWVSTDVSMVKDWAELRGLILESYRLIAPKGSVAALDGETEVTPSRHRPAQRRPKQKRPAARARRRKQP